MAISQENLLGMLIPDIYIDGITLESSGTPAIEDNPHIQHDREAQSIADFNDAMDNRTLRVSVDLCLKEQLDNTLIGSWFREQEFHKYLKIQVFQTTHSGLIQLFSHSQNMINFATTGVNEGHLTDGEIATIVDTCGSYDNAVAVMENPNKFQAALLSVSADVVGDNSDLTQISSSVDENGYSIHDFTYRAVFELSVLEPADLAVFAVSYLDLAAMKDDYDLEFNVGTLDQQNGKVVSEIAIKRSSIVSTANVWVTPNGEYWTGPVHRSGTYSWATGSTTSSSSQKLTKRTVPNDIIQDFRDVAEIMKYSLDADIKTAMSDFDKNKFCGKDRPYMDRKYLYFSDIWLSRDTSGTARFMFAFDKKEFLAKNSVYGHMLERAMASNRNAILDSANVRKMTLLRRRVKSIQTLNKLGSPYTGEILFDKNEPYVSIAMTAESGDNWLTERNTPAGSLRQSDLVTSDGLQGYGIQYYTGQDKDMQFKSDGEYQYGVRIEVEDGIQEYLRDWTKKLLLAKEDLSLYLEHSMKLGMTKYLQEVSDPHIDHSAERQASTLENSGHYDPLKNRFTARFATFMDAQYATPSSPFHQKEPWMWAFLYFEAVIIISQEAESAVLSSNLNIPERLATLISPTTGTPKGIMAVMNLFDILISKYQNLTGDDYRNRGRTSMTPIPSSAGSVQPSPSSITSGENMPGVILKCENWFFNNIFDSGAGRTSGLDYLTNLQSNNPSGVANQTQQTVNTQQVMAKHEYADIVFGNAQTRGLKMVDGGYWTQRIQTETGKFYQDTNAPTGVRMGGMALGSGGTLADASHGFLSPSALIANEQAYSMQTDADSDYYIEAEAALISANENQFPTMPDKSSDTNQSQSAKAYQSSMANVWADYNMTIMPAGYALPTPLYQSQMTDDAELTQCETQQLQAVDPFPAWTMDEDGNIITVGGHQTEEPMGTVNSDYTDFFAKMAPALAGDSVFAGNMAGAMSSSTSTSDALSTSSKGNTFSMMRADQAVAASVAVSNGISSGSTASEVYDATPNQVKSLILAQVNPGLIKLNPQPNNWVEAPEFNMNYQFISMVERFDGWETTTPAYQDQTVKVAALPSIKRPKWVTLTADYYSSIQGQEILCRLKEYSCEQLGITRPEGIDAPTYDAYFILTPFERSPSNEANNTIILMEQEVARRFERSLHGASQYSSTNEIQF